MALDRGTQSRLCLTVAHEACERYLAFVARTGATPGRSRVAGGLVSTRLLLAPQPAWRGMAGRARGSRTATLVIVGAGVALAGIATAAVAGSLSGGAGSTGTTAAASATETPSPTPLATPTQAVSSPSPTAVPTATPIPPTPLPPTPVPTAAPTPVPPRTYTVVEGDTLAEIAQRFGTTVSALQAANGIEDPDEIVVGQVLTIP